MLHENSQSVGAVGRAENAIAVLFESGLGDGSNGCFTFDDEDQFTAPTQQRRSWLGPALLKPGSQRGQMQFKSGPFADRALHGDKSAVVLDNSFDRGQAQP